MSNGKSFVQTVFQTVITESIPIGIIARKAGLGTYPQSVMHIYVQCIQKIVSKCSRIPTIVTIYCKIITIVLIQPILRSEPQTPLTILYNV